MAITVLSKTVPYPVAAGQQGFYRQDFTCTWTTTSTTGSIPSGVRKVLRMGAPAMLQQPSDDEQIYFAGTVNGDGSLALASGDVLSLARTGLAVTSGLKFTISITGYV